jgi:hypothetical protein
MTPRQLSIRLARLAFEVDRVVQQITAEPLDDGDSALITPAARHLALAVDLLEDGLYVADKLDQSRPWERLAA